VKTRSVEPITSGIFKGISFKHDIGNDTWDVYLNKKTGIVDINISFPSTRFMLGKTTQEAKANFEARPDSQSYVAEKIMNYSVWHLIMKDIEEGTTPNLDAPEMWNLVNQRVQEICLDMYEVLVSTTKFPELVKVPVSKESEEEEVREKNEVEVSHEDVEVPDDLNIPEELVWIPAGEITMRNIIRMEYDRTNKYWRIIIVDKNTGETKDIKQYNNFQVELLWRYIVEEVADFENVEGNKVMVSFNDVWNIGESISKLDPRIWGDKASLPDSEKRWELQSIFYLCTALYGGEHRGKQNRADFDFTKMIMQESKYEWSDE